MTFTSFADPTDATPTNLNTVFTALEKSGIETFNVKNAAYGALGDGTTDDTTAINAALTAALSGGIVFFPAGTYLTTGDHFITKQRVVGVGMGISIVSVTGTAGVPVFKMDNTLTPGAGLQDLTAKEGGSGNDGILLNRPRHARLTNVETEDFTTGTGFYFQNSASSWTESNILLGVRATNCLYGYRFGQKSGDIGVASFAYHTLIGTVSSMPTAGIGLWVEYNATTNPQLYGSFIRLNIYQATDSAAKGVLIGGEVLRSELFLNGENASTPTDQTWFEIASTATVREVDGVAYSEKAERKNLLQHFLLAEQAQCWD